jgi:hypothetical protein
MPVESMANHATHANAHCTALAVAIINTHCSAFVNTHIRAYHIRAHSGTNPLSERKNQKIYGLW